MHKFPDIKVVGPGSHSSEDDQLEYMEMPKDMYTFRNPILPEPEDVEDIDAGKRVLENVVAALGRYARAPQGTAIELDALDERNLDFVNQALGEGEVSVSFDSPSPIRAQEAVLAGVWRVQHFNDRGDVIRDTIEVGDVPSMVRNATFSSAGADLNADYEGADPSVQNAPAVLVELADKIKTWRPDQDVHTVNLSLLPISDGDLALIGERLGVGPVTILSRGYGNCRIGSTAFNNVWWIKYFNSQDVLILNTIEVVDVPSVARAAPEDIEDSRERLDEILELYR